MPQTPPALIVDHEGAIAHIRFNRPEVLNAANRALALAFRDACRAIEADPTVRVVVLSGAGRAFMAGGDIAEFRDNPSSIPDSLIDPLHEALLCLSRLQAPVIASLHGAVAGAGMSIALGCDLAIAAEGTRLNFAYTKLATSSDLGGSWHLPQLVGLRRAMEIALLCDTIDAAHALQLGLVNRVVAAGALASETEQWAQRLAAGAPIAMGMTKRLLRESAARELTEQLDAERAGFARCAATQDFAAAVTAFLAKREPVFHGR